MVISVGHTLIRHWRPTLLRGLCSRPPCQVTMVGWVPWQSRPRASPVIEVHTYRFTASCCGRRISTNLEVHTFWLCNNPGFCRASLAQPWSDSFWTLTQATPQYRHALAALDCCRSSGEMQKREEVARQPGDWVAIARFPKIHLQPDGASIMGVGSFSCRRLPRAVKA